jgi:hypothetical protein
VTEFGYEVMVPSRERWEQDTGLPLAERDAVLTCLGEAFVAKRGGHGATFTIVESPFAAVQIRP